MSFPVLEHGTNYLVPIAMPPQQGNTSNQLGLFQQPASHTLMELLQHILSRHPSKLQHKQLVCLKHPVLFRIGPYVAVSLYHVLFPKGK